MEEKKICSHCKTENDSEAKVCSNCERVLNQENQDNNTSNMDENVVEENNTNDNKEIKKGDNQKGEIFGTLSILAFFVGGLFISAFIPLSYSPLIFFVAGIILAVYGKIKYPSSKGPKIALIVITVSSIIFIIQLIIFMAMCGSGMDGILETCSNFPD